MLGRGELVDAWCVHLTFEFGFIEHAKETAGKATGAPAVID